MPAVCTLCILPGTLCGLLGVPLLLPRHARHGMEGQAVSVPCLPPCHHYSIEGKEAEQAVSYLPWRRTTSITMQPNSGRHGVDARWEVVVEWGKDGGRQCQCYALPA